MNLVMQFPFPAIYLIVLLFIATLILARSDKRSVWFRTMAAMEAIGCFVGIVVYLVTRRFEQLEYGMLLFALSVVPLIISVIKRESFRFVR